MITTAQMAARAHRQADEKTGAHERAAVDDECHENDVGVEVELVVLIAGS